MASITPAPSSPTPILDRLTPLPLAKRSAWALLLQIVLGIVIGAAISISGLKLVNVASGKTNLFMPLILLFDIFAAQYLAILIHECGHLIAGLSAGLRLNFVRFGPLQVNPPFRLSLRPRTGIAVGGLASLLPGVHRDFRRKYCVLLLGGPLANLLAASAMYLFFRPLSTFWSIFAALNAIVGIANLIPFNRRGAVSDGKRLLMLLRRNRQGERWLAIIRSLADIWDGVQPENLDPNLLARLTEFTDKLPDTTSAHMLAHGAAFHAHRDADAARFLEVALQHSTQVPIMTRQSLITSSAIFQARRAHNVELARQWFAQLPAKTQWPGWREEVEAAILECELQIDAAIAKLEESERLASAMPLGMQRDVTLLYLERWKKELAEQKRTIALACS